MRNISKRLLALLMAVLMLLGVSGCSEVISGFLEEVDSQLTESYLQESSVSNKPDSSKPQSSKPQSSKPESSKPESSKPESSKPESSKPESSEQESQIQLLDKDGKYYSKEDVALYIYQYKELPCNYLTKKEAEKMGWVSSKGNLWKVTDKMVIGGDRFGNYEGLLPSKKGRTYTECDVNYNGGHRGSERIIFSNDGLIYYTGDHYNTFELLYGEE